MAQRRTITFDINANLSNAKQLQQSLTQALQVNEIPALKKEKLQSSLKIITDAITKLEGFDGIQLTSSDKKTEKEIEKLFSTIGKEANNITNQLKNLSDLSSKELAEIMPKEVAQNIKNADKALEDFEKDTNTQTKNLKKQNTVLEQQKNKLEELKKEQSKLGDVQSSGKTSGQKAARTKKIANYGSFLNEFNTLKEEDPQITMKSKEAKELAENYKITETSIKGITAAYNAMKKEAKMDNDYASWNQLQKDINKTEISIEKTKEEILNLKNINPSAIETLSNSFEQLGISVDDIDFDNPETALEQLKIKFNEYVQNLLTSISVNQNFENVIQDSTETVKEAGEAAHETGKAFDEFNESEKSITNISNKLKQFFSLGSAAELFRRAVRSAVESIKELDAAMTEQAVVTDFSVGDLWEQLPEYTKQANELGVATKEAYDAATLYYQQGLKTAEVNQLTTNTLRMARIAGLDATTATDRMTNALRGFNMELNETNAQRVADVYSELAAVSATDVNELSVAMTKTASIASSANMEFENTAAFLAQMLETTRESAETAGTALKTVIGRFTEVKKLYTEGELMGSDEEGEAIDVNKVSAALRTAGIDMNKFFVGEVGLDEIFNELAKKWDSLSIVQQRYIATQAAGSRQQSRFIAMLGDYNRLLELQQYAYDADGASQKQYEKTLESLETKLNKLKNAWNNFTMGIANSKVVKGVVDLGTILLNLLNNITTAWGRFDSDGIFSFITKLGIAIGGFTIAKKGAGGIFDIIAKFLGGTDAGKAAQNTAEILKGLNLTGIFTKSTEKINLFTKALDDAGGMGKLFAGKLGRIKTSVSALGTSLSGLLTSLAPIAPYIGAIILVAGGLALAFKAIKDASPEEQFKKLSKASEEAAKEAEKCKNAYEDIPKAFDNYKQIINGLNELTEGTKEWNIQLLEANSKILELIDKYPKLIQYTKIGENGLIQINDKGWQAIQEEYEQKYKNSLTTQASINSLKASKQIQANYSTDDLKDDLSEIENISNSTVKAIVGLYNSGADITEEAIKQIDSTLTDSNITSILKTLNEFSLGTERLKTESLTYAEQAILSNSQTVPNDASGRRLVSALGGEIEEKGVQEARQKLINESEDYWTRWMDEKWFNITKKQELSLYAKEQGYDSLDDWLEFEDIDLKTAKNNLKEGKYVLGAKTATQSQTDTLDEVYKEIKNIAPELLELDLEVNYDNIDISGLSDEAQKAFKNLKKEVEKSKQETQEIIDQFGLDLEKDFNGSINKAFEFTSLNTDFPQLADAFMATLNNGSFEEVAGQIKKLGLSLGDPIQGFADLKEQLISGTPEMKKFAAMALSTSNGFYSMENQIVSLTNALSDDEKEAVTDANSIYELAKSNKTVATLMEQTGASASTMARYIKGVTDGTIDATHRTKEYVQMLDKLHAAQNTIEDSLAFIQNFDAGPSSDTIGSSWGSWIEEIETLYDKGAYGDASLENYIKAFIGEENWSSVLEQYNGDLQKSIGSVLDTINQADSNFYNAWESFAKSANGSKMVSLGSGGTIDFDLTSFSNIEELRDNIMQTQQVSKEYADAMIAAAQTYSADLKGALNAMSMRDSFGAWLENNLAELNETQYITEQQLKTFANEAQVDFEELKTNLENAADLGTIKVVAVFDEEGDLDGGLKKSIEEQFFKDNGADLDSTYEFLIELGLDDSQARDALTDLIDDFYEDTTNIPIRWNGEELKQSKEKLTNTIAVSVHNPKIDEEQRKSAATAADLYGTAVLNAISGAIKGTIDAVIGKTLSKPVDWLINRKTNGAIEGMQSQLTQMYNNLNGLSYSKAGKILDGVSGGGYLPGASSAYGNINSRASTKDGSGSGSEQEWENDFDWLQNLLNDIEANTKEMTQLQDKMNDILEEPEKYNIQDLINNLDAQITNLSKQRGYNDALIANRTKQIDDVLAQFPELAPYISKNENGTIDIVYDAIEILDKNDDAEKGELLKTVFDYAMGAADEVNSAIEENLDIDNQARALKKQFQDIATNTLSKIRESYVKYAQMQIDEEKAVSDAIKDANDELIDSLNQALEKDRQARENAEKEKELTNKEQRLAYLRMDTSGGNQLEIMRLEKELNDERQDFTDSLIDQKISELEEQNDLATEQRERQIELAEAQLEWAEQTGEISKIAEQLLQTNVDSNGKIIAGSELETILKSSDNWTSLTKEEKLAWADQMNSDLLATRGYLQYVYQAGEKAFEVKDDVVNKTMQDVANKLGALTNSIERISNSSGGSGDSGGSGYTSSGYSDGTGFSESPKTYTRQEVQDYIDQHNMREGDRARWGQDSTFNAMYQTLSASDKQQLLGADNYANTYIGQTLTLPAGTHSLYDANKKGGTWKTKTDHSIDIKDTYRNAEGKVTLYGYDNTSKKYWYYPSGTLTKKDGSQIRKVQYKTGGLADFTGPAWLDGTKSKPEMVLNATDTENFIALKDILGQFMNSRSQSQSQPKEMVNNFTINVDEISNDYDVDKLVQRVKDDLYEIGSYRNVTHVNRLR